MKRLVGSILLLLLVSGGHALAAVKVGSSVPVTVPANWWYQSSRIDEPLPDWPDWVTVANPDGIANGNSQFKFGEEACISENGQLRVIKIDGARVLVEYTTTVKAYGTAAPNGTLFFLAKSEFSRLLAKYEKEVRDAREAARREELRLRQERDHVRSLLQSK